MAAAASSRRLHLPAALLLLIRDARSPAAALALLCAATSALGCTWSGFPPAMFAVAPRHGAVLYGFIHTFATIPSVVGVAVTGWLVDVTGTNSAAFALAATVGVVGRAGFRIAVRCPTRRGVSGALHSRESGLIVGREEARDAV